MPEMQNRGALVKQVGAQLQSPAFLEQLKAALPDVGIAPDRMARIAVTEMRKNPRIAECEPLSIMGSLMLAAQFGLEPGPAGLAYLVPYGRECTLQLGYKGLLALFDRTKLRGAVQMRTVKEKDDFNYSYGSGMFVRHRPPLNEERGESVAYWAGFSLAGSSELAGLEVMDRTEMEAHRKQYCPNSFDRNGNPKATSPWTTDFDAMGCKTVLRKALKLAPQSAEPQASYRLQQAIAMDELAERGMSQGAAAELDLDAMKDVTPDEEGGGGADGADQADSR